MVAKKWLDSIEKQGRKRRRIDVKERYRHTDRQTESTTNKPVGD